MEKALNSAKSNHSFCFGKAYNYIILTILLIAGSLVSTVLKAENIVDFTNYHYYIAYAFLNDSFQNYLVPGGVNTFLNPLIELPLHLFIKCFNNCPSAVYALQGLWFGLSLFCLYKICVLFLAPKSGKDFILIFFILILAAFRQAVWIQIGTSTNEMPMLFFGLCGMYILFDLLKNPQTQNIQKVILAGFILGAGFGFKQTSLHVCLASGLMLIICHKQLQNPVRLIFCFALGGIAGFLTINGYFMWNLYREYGSPFFPFFNNIFQSEYAPEIPFQDTRTSFKLYHVFVPYFFYVAKNALCAFDLRDYMFVFGYAVLVIYFCIAVYNKCLKHKNINDPLLFALAVFLICDWFAWGFLFYTLRYLIVYSALIPLFLALIFLKLHRNKEILTYLLLAVYGCCIFIFLNGEIEFTGVVYRHKIKKFVDVEQVELPQGSLVKLYGTQTSFIIPELAKNNKFNSVTYYLKCLNEYCGLFGNGSDFVENFKFKAERDKIEQAHTGPAVYIFNLEEFNIDKNDYDYERMMLKHSLDLNILTKQNYKLGLDKIKVAEQHKGLIDEIRQNYYCRKLKNNLDVQLKICVPNEFKNYIIKQTPEKTDE